MTKSLGIVENVGAHFAKRIIEAELEEDQTDAGGNCSSIKQPKLFQSLKGLSMPCSTMTDFCSPDACNAVNTDGNKTHWR